MAKQHITKSINYDICGVLSKDENDEFIITVEGSDNFTQYSLREILEEMCDNEITIKSSDVLK